MEYSYDKKKEIYNKLSQIVELKKDDLQFIKRLMKIVNKDENKNFIMQNENGYYVNFTKLTENTISELERYLKNV